METIRRIIQLKSDRKIEITLPDPIALGLIEVVIVLQSIPPVDSSKDSLTETLREFPAQTSDLFGFLQQQVDPLQFQEQLRNEWGE